jgi:hypothetical protein
MSKFRRYRRCRLLLLLCIPSLFIATQVFAQQSGSLEGRALYDVLKKFELQGKASVAKLKLRRDRVAMSFTGDFYFMAPVNGRVTGAVFIGEGTVESSAPPNPYEQEILTKFLNAEYISSHFRQAVFRFSDDTFDIIGKGADKSGTAPAEAQKLASEMEPRLLKETGINVSSRLLLSLANNEKQGFFLAQFDKGELGRFTFLLDPQARIPSLVFGINSGEKVMMFRYEANSYGNDIWIATYSMDDFSQKLSGGSFLSDFNLVAPLNYKMEIDLRDPRKILATQIHIDFQSLDDNLRVISMMLNEGLTSRDNDYNRQKYSMLAKSAKLAGQDIPFIQEEMEIGLTLLLPKAMPKNEKFSVDLQIAGDSVDRQRAIENFYFPQSPSSSWYPRYGLLARSTFDLIFRHRKNDKISSIGALVREAESPDEKGVQLTEFKIDKPINSITFTAGLLERHTKVFKPSGGNDIQFSFDSISATIANVKEQFILTEMENAVNGFSILLGPYPYLDYRATYHPSQSQQGYATLIRFPKMDEANRNTFKVIGRQAAYQWLGNFVGWRSYRDQWLGDGFAEYCGMLYTRLRENGRDYSMKELIKTARFNLFNTTPTTDTGSGKGKLPDIGSLLLGKRLTTRNSLNADQLIQNKGALVMRMLHFLFTDPASSRFDLFNTDPSKVDLFKKMLTDFVQQYGGKQASTEEFMEVASKHFAETPIGMRFKQLGIEGLDWFTDQWVKGSKIPSYRLEYRVESEGDKPVMTGTIYQENVGKKQENADTTQENTDKEKDWYMPLPLLIKSGGKEYRVLVFAIGPKTPLPKIPIKPDSIELDPDMWILSEKTTAKKM